MLICQDLWKFIELLYVMFLKNIALMLFEPYCGLPEHVFFLGNYVQPSKIFVRQNLLNVHETFRKHDLSWERYVSNFLKTQ